MARTVGNEGDKLVGISFGIAKELIYSLDNYADKVDVLPLVEASDIVGVGDFALVENQVDSSRVVLDVEPIAYILALAINGERLAVADIVDNNGINFSGN